ITGQIVEKFGCICSDILIGSEQPEVCVDLCRSGIIVACAQMDVAPNYPLFLPHYKSDLRVGLYAQQAVDQMHARTLHLSGPDYIVLSDKSRFELYYCCDLFAALT